MRKNRLGIFEKMWLGIRAYYDVRRERFQRCDIADAEARILRTRKRKRHSSQRKSAPDPRPGASRPTNPPPADLMNATDGEYLLIISPYFNSELGKFEAFREYALGRRRTRCRTVNERLRKRRVRGPFTEVIANLDQRVSVLEARINLLFADYEERIQQCQSQRENHEHRGEPHMVQMYINRILALRGDYYSKASRLYDSVVHLLSEKIKLITALEGLLRQKRAHSFLRIRYYYQRAVMRAKVLPADYLSDEVLMNVANTELLMDFEEIRNETQEKLKQIQDEIAAFSSLR